MSFIFRLITSLIQSSRLDDGENRLVFEVGSGFQNGSNFFCAKHIWQSVFSVENLRRPPNTLSQYDLMALIA